MDALNALRAVLVACALIATVILATRGMWIPVTVLSIGIGAHVALFVRQRQLRQQAHNRAMVIDGGTHNA